MEFPNGFYQEEERCGDPRSLGESAEDRLLRSESAVPREDCRLSGGSLSEGAGGLEQPREGGGCRMQA